MNLFDQNRNYVLGDDELNLIGDRDKLAQWRLCERLKFSWKPHFERSR